MHVEIEISTTEIAGFIVGTAVMITVAIADHAFDAIVRITSEACDGRHGIVMVIFFVHKECGVAAVVVDRFGLKFNVSWTGILVIEVEDHHIAL